MSTKNRKPLLPLTCLLSLALLMGLFALPAAASTGLPDTAVETTTSLASELPLDLDESSEAPPSLPDSSMEEDTSFAEDSSVSSDTSILEDIQPGNESTSLVEDTVQMADAVTTFALHDRTAASWAEFEAAVAEILTEDDQTGTITLLDSFMLEETVELPVGSHLTVTGNNHILTVEADKRHFIVRDATLELTDVILEGNSTGGGIHGYGYAGEITVTGGAIQNCLYNGGARGAAVYTSHPLALVDVVVDNCNPTALEVVDLVLAGNTVIKNNTSWAVYAGGNVTMRGKAQITLSDGGMIVSTAGKVVNMYDESSITYITSTARAALEVRAGAVNLYDSSHISNNTVGSRDVSAVMLLGSDLKLYNNSQISYNEFHASLGSGGAVRGEFEYGNDSLTSRVSSIRLFDNSQISHNYSSRGAGAISAKNTYIELSGNAQISYNRAVQSGGAITSSQYDDKGRTQTAWVVLSGNSSMVGNACGINGSATAHGGAINLSGEDNYSYGLIVNAGTSLRNNRAGGLGGAVYIWETPASFNLSNLATYTNSAFSGNYSNLGVYKYTGFSLSQAKLDEEYNRPATSVSKAVNPSVINNYDVALRNGGAAIGNLVTVDFVVDSVLKASQTIAKNTEADEPTLAELNLPAGTLLDGWYTQEDKVGELAYKWTFGDGVPASMRLYAEIIPPVKHTVTVSFYRDASDGSGTLLQQDVWQVDDGDNTLSTLEARFGTPWLDAYKPGNGYQPGVLASHAALPDKILQNETFIVVYQPTPPNKHAVTFYQNHFDTDPEEFKIEPEVAAGALVPKPTPDPTRTGYLFTYWTQAREENSGIWNFTSDAMPDAPLSLYAQYDILQFQAIFDYGQVYSGSDRYSYQIVDYNSLLAAEPTEMPGYTFEGWRYNGRYWDFNRDRIPAEDILLVGVWTKTVPPTTTSPDASANSSASSGITTSPVGESTTTSRKSGGGGSGGGTATTTSRAVTASSSRQTSSSSSGASLSSTVSSASSNVPVAGTVSSVDASIPLPPVSEPEAIAEDIPVVETIPSLFGIPLGGFSFEGWSLLNLLLAVLLLASAVLRSFALFQSKRRSNRIDAKDFETNGRRAANPTQILFILTIVIGVLAVPLLLLLEDFQAQFTVVNQFSPLFLLLALVQAALTIVSSVLAKKTSGLQ